MPLEPTGERMVLEHYQSSVEDRIIYLMHMAAYRFADAHVHGKRVLDYGCGSGYGSALIAQHAASVVGVDVAQDAVSYASSAFAGERLSFRTVGADDPLPFDDASFDVILSFQVFEHISDTRRYLSECRRVLARGGALLLVTPDRSTRLFPFQRPWNRWHVTEYSARSLSDALRTTFPTVEMLRMGGRPDVIELELRRCRKFRWLTLPFTLPVIPDASRVWLLNQLHRWRGRRSTSPVTIQPDFDEGAIMIGPDLAPSLGLVAVARC